MKRGNPYDGTNITRGRAVKKGQFPDYLDMIADELGDRIPLRTHQLHSEHFQKHKLFQL